MCQNGEGEARPGANSSHDGRRTSPGAESESEDGHQQGGEGQVQVPAEVLPPWSFLPGEQHSQPWYYPEFLE